MHYPLIHESNQRPWHFLQAYGRYLEETLGVRAPLSEFNGDVHLSDEERDRSILAETFDLPDRYWIVVAGGKFDFTAKWWNPASFQRVVDLLRDRVAFVQCGESGHWHPPLEGVTSLVGKTDLRQFVSLMHFADGVLCPVTFAMHLAAAVEPFPGGPRNRPCVVVAGGREPQHWEAYPHHQFISAVGALSCCSSGGCWKSRCQLVGDGDQKDRRGLCEQPVQVTPDLRLPRCMTMITPEDVVRRIEYYLDGDQPRASLTTTKPRAAKPAANSAERQAPAAPRREASLPIPVRIEGAPWDVAALPVALAHLRRYRPDAQYEPDLAPEQLPWARALGLDVADGGDSLRAGRTLRLALRDTSAPVAWPPTPIARTIASQLRLTPIEDLCRPQEKKPKRDLRADVTLQKLGVEIADAETRLVVAQFPKSRRCEHAGGARRLAMPKLDVFRVRHLSTMPAGCSTSRFYALTEAADLLVGVDSGPLHAASLTDLPKIGLWMPGHYPARYSLPDDRQLNLVLSGPTAELNRHHRVPWNIVEQPGQQFDPAWLASQCARMLEPPRYLDKDHAARDVLLRQWIGEWCRSPRSELAAEYSDRNRSFDALLRETTARFGRPTFVETGTIRAEDDFAGAGYSTYVFGAYVAARGGRLHSVDLDKTHVRFAARRCEVFGDAVTVHGRDSVGFLAEFDQPIDVLYLDSLDTYEPGHAEHAMRELQAALPWLHERSLILLDDTPFVGSAFTGKGAVAVPWLLEHGWELLYAGRQALLRRTSR